MCYGCFDYGVTASRSVDLCRAFGTFPCRYAGFALGWAFGGKFSKKHFPCPAVGCAREKRTQRVEKTIEAKRTVIDGLDVTVTVLRKDGDIYLKLRSILRPYGDD